MKNYILYLWSLFDPIYFFFSNLTYLPADKEKNIFRIRLTKYKGRQISLSDGTEIYKNDLLVKIHLHNVRLLLDVKDIKSEAKKARMIYRSVQNSLPAVEQFIRTHPLSHEIKGIIGITSLSKGCKRLGFELMAISHPLYKIFKRFAFFSIVFLSSNSSVKEYIEDQEPLYLFMSTPQLARMYRKL